MAVDGVVAVAAAVVLVVDVASAAALANVISVLVEFVGLDVDVDLVATSADLASVVHLVLVDLVEAAVDLAAAVVASVPAALVLADQQRRKILVLADLVLLDPAVALYL
jgi:hypothetical protein